MSPGQRIRRRYARKTRRQKVAILVTDGFEQVEFTELRKRLNAAGAATHLVSPAKGKVQGMNHDEKGDKFTVDVASMTPTSTTTTPSSCPAGSPIRIRCAHQRQGRTFRQSILRSRQTRCCDLPWPVDADRGRRRPWSSGDELAVAEDGPAQRRRRLGRRGGRHRSGPRHQPQARRPSGLQSQDDRRDRRRCPRRPARLTIKPNWE